jgi:hypothetical protein
MTTRYDYRVYCKTESKWVEGTTRSAAKPDTCFHNDSHIIEASATTLTGTVSPQVVTLAEEETATGGNYKCDGVSFTAAPADLVDGVLVPRVTTHDIKYPFPINLLNTYSNLDGSHKGNSLDVYFVPDSVIGGTTQIDGINTDSIMLVSGISLPNFIVGAQLSVADGQGPVSMGTVMSVDSNTNEIVASADVTRPFNQGSVVTVSYPTAAGVLTANAVGSVLTVNPELAAAAILGVTAKIDGVSVGIVIAINGLELTVAGTPVDAITSDVVTLSMLPFSTPLLEDLLPRNVLEVQDTCIQYGQVGMNIKITDGVNLDNMGRIVSLDKATKRIEVEFPPTRSYPSGSYIMVTRYLIETIEFGSDGAYPFSSGRNKSSYIEKGKIGRISYTNRTAAPTRFTMKLEYLH